MSHKCGSVAVLLGLSITAALYGQKKPDFSRFVVAGDSLSAGYQNSQLIESGQVHGYANVIATQAGVSLNLPLLPDPGYPQVVAVPPSYAFVTTAYPVARRNYEQTLDVAVPGFTVGALVGLQPSCTPDLGNPIEVMAAEILNPNCSIHPIPTELAEAAGLAPTTAILWVGSNDALFSLLFNDTPPTALVQFSYLYHLAATTMAAASGHLVVANIPDVTLTPYLTSVPKLASIFHLSVGDMNTIFGLHRGDMVTPYAFSFIQAGLAPPDSGLQGPIVIRANTLSHIRNAVRAYNAVIAQEASDNGATLVDIYSLINNLADHGVVVNGRTLTTDFMGGLFSLDGVHPTNTGYAIIANEFIKTMNRSLRAGIPLANVGLVSQNDPLIFSQNAQAISTGHVEVGMADGLRRLGRR